MRSPLPRFSGQSSLAFGLLAIAAAHGQAIWYVDQPSTAPTPDGVSWCTAFLDLQDALAVSSSGDEVRVADGIYTPDRSTGDRNATFRLVNGVAVYGGYAGCGAADANARNIASTPSILSGDLLWNDGPNFANYSDNSYHVVTCDDPTATNSTVFDGFIVRGGYANGTLALKTDQGSGFHNFNGVNPFTGKPLVRNCTFKENWAANHGAVNDHGGMTLINCEFRDNHAGMWGGGLYIHGGLATSVTGCGFHNNQTDGLLIDANGDGELDGGGGGAVVSEGTPTFTDCLFQENSSLGNGGGMYFHDGGVATLSHCTFELNSAPNQGGAVYVTEASWVSFSNCAFSANTAQFQGGGVYLDSASVVHMNQCSFASNAMNGPGNVPDSFHGGGAVYVKNDADLTATDCPFTGNTSTRYGGAVSHTDAGDLRMVRCTFDGNSAVQRSGAVEIYQSDRAQFVNCLFTGNSASSGGAARVKYVQAEVANCRFIGNTASLRGGAMEFTLSDFNIYNSSFLNNSSAFNGTLARGGALNIYSANDGTISNCTFTGNSAFGGGEAIALDGELVFQGVVYIRNSIIWNGLNGFQRFSGTAVNMTYTVEPGGWPGVGNIVTDPLFVDTANGDLRLTDMSPCLNTGNTSVLPADSLDLDGDGDISEPIPMDLAGGVRVYGLSVDRGAFESQPAMGPVPAASTWGLIFLSTVTLVGGSILLLGRARQSSE